MFLLCLTILRVMGIKAGSWLDAGAEDRIDTSVARNWTWSDYCQ